MSATEARPVLSEPTRAAARYSRLPSVHAVAIATVLGAILLIASGPHIDTDLWWHLLVGQQILDRHAIPASDYLSFTFAGQPWIDHEWLAEVVFALGYRVAGLWGPIVLSGLVVFAAYVLVYRTMVLLGVNRLVTPFLLIAAAVPASITWGPRPQMISLLFLAAFALLLHEYDLAGNRRLLWPMPLLMVLWANLHGGWVLGLVLIASFLAGSLVERRTGTGRSAPSAPRDLGIVLVLSLVAAAVNPYGVKEVLYPIVWLVPSAYSNVLNEWLSTDFHNPLMMVFEAMLLLLIVSVWVSRPTVRWPHVALVTVFTYLALTEERNVAVWCVVITPLLGLYATQALAVLKSAAVGRRQAVVTPRAGALNALLLVGILALWAALGARYLTNAALQENERLNFPVGAVRYMKMHTLPPHVFNSYAWGGYLLWNLYPRYRDFIDGRANTLFDTRILNDYFRIYDAAPRYPAELDRRAVQDVLVERGAPIDTALSGSSRWSRVYRDAHAVVYTRR